MAAVFEIFIGSADSSYAAEASQAAFEELDRLERELSRFITTSDISRINHASAGHTIRIGWDAFQCLHRCLELRDETLGAFDITIGSAVERCKQGFTEQSEQRLEDRSEYPIHMNDEELTVTVLAPVSIDLGGYGKGYALDCMAELLREWDIESALLHSGRSTALALDPPEGKCGWPVSIRHPKTNKVIQTFELKHRAISGSGVQKGSHIIDPRTGCPVEDTLASWCLAECAGDADAFSTTLMVMSREEVKLFSDRNPDISFIILHESNDETIKIMR